MKEHHFICPLVNEVVRVVSIDVSGVQTLYFSQALELKCI